MTAKITNSDFQHLPELIRGLLFHAYTKETLQRYGWKNSTTQKQAKKILKAMKSDKAAALSEQKNIRENFSDTPEDNWGLANAAFELKRLENALKFTEKAIASGKLPE